MRVSVDKNDEGHKRYVWITSHGKDVKVYLDGVEQKQCITADDELGLVVRNVLDESGDIQIDPENMDHILTEQVNGEVVFEIFERG